MEIQVFYNDETSNDFADYRGIPYPIGWFWQDTGTKPVGPFTTRSDALKDIGTLGE